MYDLIVRGRVLDPGQKLDGQYDVAITDGRIAAITATRDEADATRILDARGQNRFVLPGLVNVHTHVAYGAFTAGLGMMAAEPDLIGVASGVTTEVDAGSAGVANVGVVANYVLPTAKTRVLAYVNLGSYAFSMPGRADVMRMDEIDPKAIRLCIEKNPGLISGIKLRLVGAIMAERGEDVIRLAKNVAREHGLPLIVHIGDPRADSARFREITRFLLTTLEAGDTLTHVCTDEPGGVMDDLLRPLPELSEARAAGVVMDASTGRTHFGFATARRQAELGIHPDTISSDSAASGRSMFFSLLEAMGKYMAVGYSFSDVVRMTTTNAARALRVEELAGSIAVGREADLSIVDVVTGRWSFIDSLQRVVGDRAIVPVHTLRAGTLFPPAWGPRPWGWLPEEA